ncbi:MAG: prepilin-type N-terminal cleavage/methylation domain-containing protein [Planctomycetota bacterium]|nr:MAG: prepilin-type N-terminal cleavage/methylation domain-containing protein [Planctomycetota bacterium]
MDAVRAGGRRSFTLIELLVVIGIIAVLAGLTVPAISAVRRRSQVSSTTSLLQRLALALEQYENDFGDYPPSRFRAAGLGKSNGLNEGSECLTRCLTTSRRSGPYFEFADAELGNTDGDRIVGVREDPTGSIIRNAELLEVVDAWGNPVAYLHNAVYGQGASVSLPREDGEGRAPARVEADTSGKTGQYRGLTTFQLWSAGPDALAGTDDDIRIVGE